MAISVGTYTTVRSSSTVGVSGAQSDTYNMPSSGIDRGLVIIIVVQANGTPSTVSAVSYGSSGTLTEVVTNQHSRTRTYIYCVENPDTGSNTLAFTLDDSINRSHSVHAIPLTGVHQTDMSGVTDTLGYLNSTTMNKSVTTGTDNSELVGICEANYDGASMNPFSESASNTMLNENGTGTGTNFDHEWWVGHRATTTAGAYTFGGTGNSISAGSLVVVEVLEAAAGGGTDITAKTATVPISGVKASVSYDKTITAKTATVPISGVKAIVTTGTAIVAKTATVPIVGVKATVTYDTGVTNITAKTATVAILGVKATVVGTAVAAGGGDSMSLRQMRRREREQILEAWRQDDEVVLMLFEAIRRGRR